MITKVCQECGKEFQARSAQQKFCAGPHFTKCVICGNEFEYKCSPSTKPHTCSQKCKTEYRKQSVMKKYGVEHVSQIPEVRKKKSITTASKESQDKMKKTCLAKYGVERANQSKEVRKKISESLKSEAVREKCKATFQEHYGVDHVFASKSFREKHGCNTVAKRDNTKKAVKRAVFEKYGVDNVSSIPGVTERAKVNREKTVRARYGANYIFATDMFKEHMKSAFGVSNPIYNPSLLSKAARNKQHTSNLEKRLHAFLNAYNIQYEPEYVLTSGELVHSFDVYIPKYKILIDCDGEYWHAYLSDPDGNRVRDDGDPVRLALVPDDHIFLLLIEQDFERGLRALQKILKELDSGIFNYDSDIFNWCRSTGFPYHSYSDDRLAQEWHRLKHYEVPKYNENCTIGIAWVNQFHRSIYDARVRNDPSPREAWEDDELLKKVIANRLIYRNDVDPAKVLNGFNIAKIATKVSVFNPILARYITQRYLNQFDTIFDPFSGFSGRLLGVTSCGKSYIGQDLLITHVDESRQLANKLVSFDPSVNIQLAVQDILTDADSSYPALFTCPPYMNVEVYGDEAVFKSCDDWITTCLDTYDCKRYVFVVNTTVRYTNYVVDELKSKSHFRKSSEYIIVIDK